MNQYIKEYADLIANPERHKHIAWFTDGLLGGRPWVHIGKIKDDEANKLGISWLWALPISHPLTPAGWIHDQLYRSDISKNLSRRYADRVFLEICNRLSGNSWKLKAQAHLFYRIVRLAGSFFWEGRP